MEDTKKCNKCEEEKTLDCFASNKFTDDGLYNTCVSCVSSRVVIKRGTKKPSKHKGQFSKKKSDGDGNFYSRNNSIKFNASHKWRTLRYKLLKESNRTCCVCGRSREFHSIVLHLDHIVPKSVDWSKRFDEDNLQVLCEDCNMGKGNKDSIDWR